MAGVDVVARLQLKAEQFSSETGARFAEMKTRARSAAEEVRDSFSSSFAEVQRLASQALVAPRTSGGGLDLRGEIASLEQSAAAADRKSEALRAMSVAATAASNATGVDAQALRLEADAAAVAALAEDRLADEIRGRIGALSAVQTELDRTGVAMQQHAVVGQQVTASAGMQRAAMQQLGFQVNDIALGFSAGTPPMVIFAQQGGQVVQALQMMTTKTTGLLGFLGGPWGAALTAATVVLVPLVARLFETNSELDKQIEKLRKNAIEAENADRAKQAFAATEVGLIAGVRELTAELTKQNEALLTNAERLNISAKNKIEGLRDRRGDVVLELANARREVDAARVAETSGAPGALAAALATVTSVEQRLQAIDTKIAEAEAALLRTRADLAGEAAKRSSDPLEQIKRKYEGPDGLIERAKARAVAEGAVTTALTAQLRKLQEARQLEEDRARQAAKKPATVSLGNQLQGEQGARLLASAQGYSGLSERSVSGNSALRSLFKEANVTIDPKMVAWCAAFVNSVLATNGLPGTGSLSAKSFLNYGTATAKPTAGDIVVLKRGNSGGHVGFYEGTDARGNVRVTGGNQGDGVNTSTFARSDVLSFRRAPTASAAYADTLKREKDAAKEAEQALRELEATSRSLTSSLDPGQAALDAYAKTLRDIAAVEASGQIAPERAFAFRQAARGQYDAAQSRIAQDRFDTTFSDPRYAEAAEAFSRHIEDVGERFGARFDDSVRSAGETFQDLIGGAADLFGIRLSGPFAALLQPGGIAGAAKDAAEDFAAVMKTVGVKLDKGSVDAITGVLQGAAYGQIGGSIFASISGGKQNKVASGIGGALGEVAGKEVGKVVAKEIGGSLGKSLGGAAGPIGAVLGGVLGNVVAGLFTKAPKGSAGISTSGGTISAGAASGTTADAKSGAATLAGSVSNGLNQIAQLLGAKVTGSTDVQIGTYKGELRVNDHGGAIGGVKGSGAIAFASEEAAIAYALTDALRDGVLSGISAASLKILQGGKDLQRSIEKALMIENIPKQLKAMVDPVGAALDTLNTKFQKMKDALDEGGATAEQYAQAERLYALEKEQTIATTAKASQALKDFLTSMTVGSNSPLSLRSQETTALATLRPFLDQIEAGKSVDQAKYQAAAQTFLDIERQLYGSTTQYFDAFDQVQAATNKAIAAIDNVAPISPAVPDPFTKATADSSAKTAAGVQTGNEMTQDTNQLLAENNRLIAKLLAAVDSGGSGDFIGSARMFATAI